MRFLTIKGNEKAALSIVTAMVISLLLTFSVLPTSAKTSFLCEGAGEGCQVLERNFCGPLQILFGTCSQWVEHKKTPLGL